jgi:hypothetical protein
MVTAVAFALLTSWWAQSPLFHVLPLALVFFGVGGVFWGEIMWRHICRRINSDERL